MKLETYVIDALGFDQWQTASEIRHAVISIAIAGGDWGGVSFLISFFSVKAAEAWMRYWRWPAAVYTIVDRFDAQGYIEHRWRNISFEVFLARGGRRAREYRLTDSGLRRRSGKPLLSPASALHVV